MLEPPGGGVIAGCKLLDMGPGNWDSGPVQKQYVGLTAISPDTIYLFVCLIMVCVGEM